MASFLNQAPPDGRGKLASDPPLVNAWAVGNPANGLRATGSAPGRRQIEADGELLELLVGDGGGGAGHQVHAAGGFREGDHVADGGRTGEVGDQAVDAEGDAA